MTELNVGPGDAEWSPDLQIFGAMGSAHNRRRNRSICHCRLPYEQLPLTKERGVHQERDVMGCP